MTSFPKPIPIKGEIGFLFFPYCSSFKCNSTHYTHKKRFIKWKNIMEFFSLIFSVYLKY